MTDASLIPAFVNRGSGSFEKARDALASSGRFDIREIDGERLEEEIKNAVAGGANDRGAGWFGGARKALRSRCAVGSSRGTITARPALVAAPRVDLSGELRDGRRFE